MPAVLADWVLTGRNTVVAEETGGSRVLILGIPADRIRALGEDWSDGGLWDDILFLALLAWAAADDHERRMRWHHLVMAAGNFKRQNGRRLRPSRISPADNLTCSARAEHFSGPDGLTISRDDAKSWQNLQNSLNGAGAAMTTTLLAALWPDSHHILDWRVLAAVTGLGLVAGGENDLHLAEPGGQNQLDPDLDLYFKVRELLIRQSGEAGVPLRTTERALYLMSRAVHGNGMTWADYGTALCAATTCGRVSDADGRADDEQDTPPAAP
jgi:hypothetical protein